LEREIKSLMTSIICLLYLIYAIPLGTDVRAQENSNATLEKMLSVMRDERKSISEIKNLTSAELGLLEHLAVSSGRTSTQAAFTALSVFFLGIALVLFGLRLTTRAAKAVGRYFNLMMWALTLPVVIMVAVYQIGVVTGIPIAIYSQDEPYLFISALLLVPIAIVLFLLAAQRRIIAHLEKGTDGIGKR